ncbi:baseplate J/gp47 family protein [uncultured Thiodictyon sp.]|uniref:baseplate J/gp47 family protein n=1 Tax=uncultured Thiodictyon sp. TaxID=1846217 RepID=UPI0025E89DE9|nr:baseplate J/gp47 family protein [uncultured Thiodictyon sp.]
MPADAPYYTKDYAGLVQDLLAHLGSGGGGRTVLADTTEGSVVRTLAEAFARELAVAYGQLDGVYRSAFVETAEGVALDNVVALLGIARRRAGHVEGSVTFARAQPAAGDIPIPAGTLLAGREVAQFATIEESAIARGEREVTVAVRSVEPGTERIPAGALGVMPRPLWGVESVANRLELVPVKLPEDDAGLRQRARSALLLSQRGTVAALEEAVRALGIARVTVRESAESIGTCEVILGDPDLPDALVAAAQAAVEEVRPAGIRVRVHATVEVRIRLRALLELREDYPEPRRAALRAALERGLTDYIGSLQVGEPVRWAKVGALLAAPEEVAQLHPARAPDGTELAYLEPYVGQPGALRQDAANHWQRNGDIQVGPAERARLDLAVLPLELRLEPPASKVWVDLTCTLAASTAREAGLADRLRAAVKPMLEAVKAGDTLTLAALLEAVRTGGVESVSARVLHDRDGQALELIPGSARQTAVLGEREVLGLGQLSLLGGRDAGAAGG